MKKNFKYCSSVIALGTLMFFAGCSNSTKPDDKGKPETVKVDSLPSKPVDKQTYSDSNGNQWMWNAAMMCWMMNNSGRENNYYYYPSTGSYTDPSGRTVTPPSSVSSGISNDVKARTQPVTVTRSSSNVKSSSSSSTSSKGRSVFGSTGRSHSISA